MGKIKHVLVLDLESYYDRESCTLKKLSPPEYIFHPKFAVHILAAYDLSWPAPRIIEAQDIPAFLEQYPAVETASVSHNALFDQAVLAWKYGWVPGRMLDTLGMSRSLRTFDRYSLGAVAKGLFGHDPKGDIIHKVAGLDIQGIKNAGLWPDYKTYAMQDARTCAQIFMKLYPEFPDEEQLIMDLVLRAAVVPKLHANVPLLQTHLENLRKYKAHLLRDCGYDKASLMSTVQFEEALKSLGVEIQTKPGARGPIPAFAKTDSFMTELLEYDKADDERINNQVQCLAMARLSHKSTLEETRAERFLNVARLPWGNGALMPVPLRYGGAHTHRLSGEWSMNMQNLPRDKTKSKLRQALKAPPGCKLITCDLSQIEARLVAYLCGQEMLTELFRSGADVYARFASFVFNRPVNKQDQPFERFVGKVGILGLGYGCGPDRFYQMVVSQAKQNNLPVAGKFDEWLAARTVRAYRKIFRCIPSTWRLLDDYLARIINDHNTEQCIQWGPVQFESGKIILPNKMTLRYQIGDNKLYGAKILENVTQALARIVIMQAALRLNKEGFRFLLQSHDELVFAVDEMQIDVAKQIILDEMVREPDWLPGIPLAAEIGVGDNYGETK